MMNKIYQKAFLVFTLFVAVNQLFSQTLNDGPIQLQVKLREFNYNIGTLSDFTLSIGNFNLPGSLSSDEAVIRVWARDKGDVDGFDWDLTLGGNPHVANFGAPGVSSDYNELIYDHTFAGTTVPRYFDVKLNAFEDDVPNDFSPISGLTPCGSTGSITQYDASICCLNLFGCLFSEGDDNLCDANPYKTNLDYRLGNPCEWYSHGFLDNPNACSGANYYHPRVESFWRYIDGASCATAINLGTLTSGGPSLIHKNSTACYANTHTASPGNDVWYKFSITGPIGITVKTCDPYTNFDTHVYLYSSCGATVADTSDNDGCGGTAGPSLFGYSLCQPGDYYIVVDGETALDAGTFQLEVADNPNFVYTATMEVNNVTCFGANNGSITAHVTGGEPPYTFAWAAPATGTDSTTTGLGPGTYTVSITDAKGCQLTKTATVTEPAQIGLTTTSTPVRCGGASDGTATANPTGGTTPYSYLWSSLPPQTFQTATLLPAGNYNVTVVDDQGCSVSATVTVANTTTVVIAVDSVKNVQCFGAQNGGIYLTTSGGQTPYTYAWSPNNATTEDNTNLGPNTYTVVVRDNIGCTVGDTWVITEPPVLTSSVSDTRNPTCNGDTSGIVDIAVGGGTQPYSYLWSAPTNATTQNINHVGAGTHTITVTDANGCTLTSSATLTEPSTLDATVTPGTIQCFGDANGTATLNVSGATPPYTYFWSSFETTQNASALDGGNFSVLVSDANDCSVVLTGTIATPSPLNIPAPTVFEPLCAAAGTLGSITVAPTGGTTPYTYSWTGGLSAVANPSAASGTYSVTVTDAHSCTANASATVNAPDPLTFNVTGTNPSCIGDSSGVVSVLDLSGGVGPYNYTWSNSTSATGQLTRLSVGTYQVTVTDANGCSATGVASIQDPLEDAADCTSDNNVVLVPTAFSPNGDNVNDKLVAIVRNVQKLDFKVFNRWGEMVYSNPNMVPTEGWDGVYKGREQPVGTYIYIWDVTYQNGVHDIQSGSSTLVR